VTVKWMKSQRTQKCYKIINEIKELNETPKWTLRTMK
jgi:hypothetical protein